MPRLYQIFEWVLVCLWLPLMAPAQTSTERFRQLTVAPLPCDSLNAELEKLIPAGKDISDEKYSLPIANLGAALSQVKRIPTPTRADVDIEVQALKEGPEEVIADYLVLVGSGCHPIRLYLNRWIINTASENGVPLEQKEEAKSMLKSALVLPQHPTFLNAFINITILKFGIEKKFWWLTKADVSALEKIKKDLKGKSDSLGKKWQELKDVDLTNRNKIPRDKFAAQLRSNPKFQKEKELLAQEIGGHVRSSVEI
ncbi:MAG: hypothetical protein AB7F43_15560 [Bacteriovoracia bacterium]